MFVKPSLIDNFLIVVKRMWIWMKESPAKSAEKHLLERSMGGGDYLVVVYFMDCIWQEKWICKWIYGEVQCKYPKSFPYNSRQPGRISISVSIPLLKGFLLAVSFYHYYLSVVKRVSLIVYLTCFLFLCLSFFCMSLYLVFVFVCPLASLAHQWDPAFCSVWCLGSKRFLDL